MSAKRPLVVNTSTGEIEQLSTSDYLDERDIVSVQNETGGALVVGTPIYQTAVADQVDKAKADDISTAKVLGLVLDVSIADGNAGSALTDGRMTATTGQWDAVTGETGGLTPGGRYFLDAATASRQDDSDAPDCR